MIEQKNIPFVGKPVKLAYMWRDIERRARSRGLEPRLPAPYPLAEFDLANRIAIVGESEGWCADYVRAAYRHWFHSGHEPGSEPGLSDALREIGQSPARVVEAAKSEAIGERYKPRPKRPSRSACSARRRSSSTAKCFGETTTSTTRFVGARAAAPNSISTMGLPILNCRPRRASATSPLLLTTA